jgi:hypothetical protein
MSEERRKVLEMLAAGKISAEQAEKLLDKLAGGGANQSNASESQAASTPSGASKPKYLRIVVDSPGRDPVNVRVPISLAGSARRLLAVMPLQVSERLAEHGIDAGFFSGAKGENLDEMMRELNIDVEEGKGKKVRIFCE